MKIWKKNLYSVFIAEIISISGMAFIVPFLPLYVKELGVTEIGQIARWSGLLVSAPSIAMVFVSPIWGSLADRFGRKIMVERALFGSAITMFLMSMANNVTQLLLLRLLQGVFSGTIAACNALISTTCPEKRMGTSIGLLQTGVFLGNFLGPLMGGITADIFGFQNSFRITSTLLFFAGCLVFFLVRENFIYRPIKKRNIPFTLKIRLVSQNKILIIMILLLFFFQFSIRAVTPIFSLFVETMVTNPNTVSSISGFLFAMTGLTSALSAIIMSKFFEKNPSFTILFIGFLGAGIIFISQGFITNVIQLGFLRLCLGIFYGAIIPIANTIISLSISSQNRGKVFGISSSFNFLGKILGPIMGSLIVTAYNIPFIFFFSGISLVCTGLVLYTVLKNIEIPFFQEDQDVDVKKTVSREAFSTYNK